MTVRAPVLIVYMIVVAVLHICHAGTNIPTLSGGSQRKNPHDEYFQPKRFANGMSVVFRLKGTSDQAFASASNALSSVGLTITKLDRHLHLIQGIPAKPDGSLAEIDRISIQQIGFIPRPDFRYVEWHISLFWKDGIRKAKTDPSFAADPKVTERLRGILKRIFDAIAKEMLPLPPRMPRPK